MRIQRLKFFSGAEENRTWEEDLIRELRKGSVKWIINKKNPQYIKDRNKQFSLGLVIKKKIKDLESSLESGYIYDNR